MRLVHGLIKLVMTAAVIAGGVLLYRFPVGELYDLLESTDIPDASLYRQIGGVAIAIAAFLTLLPRLPKKKGAKEISYSSAHGEVTIQLDHIESTLERVVTKLPEVKSISLYIKPLEGQGRVQVVAKAILMKDAEAEAMQITNRVNSYIQLHTRKLLGLKDVEVRLRVTRILVNLRSVRPEPLMLEAPQKEEPESPPETAPPSEPPSEAEIYDPDSEPDKS